MRPQNSPTNNGFRLSIDLQCCAWLSIIRERKIRGRRQRIAPSRSACFRGDCLLVIRSQGQFQVPQPSFNLLGVANRCVISLSL